MCRFDHHRPGSVRSDEGPRAEAHRDRAECRHQRHRELDRLRVLGRRSDQGDGTG